ncbi:hypothetical protein PENTCL1PPCAC_14157, partial [Pristionchus entomophagus]
MSNAFSSTESHIWVFVLIVISVILTVGLCIGAIMLVRRHIRSLRAEIAEVQLESDKRHQTVSNIKTLGDNSMPEKRDEWEIERRFVGIDYMHKLGDGSFGSVYLGHVLARNIPTGLGRSIAELAALK